MFSDVCNEYWPGTEACAAPVPVFQGFKTLIWIHHRLTHESKTPLPTMFITSSLWLLIFKWKEHQGYLVTGKMFTPVNKTLSGALIIHGPLPHGHSTHEDVQKEKMSNYSQVIQRRMAYKLKRKWQSFFSFFTINTFNSLAERQAKFKIVHIWKFYHTLC